jgi:hypothetical protein
LSQPLFLLKVSKVKLKITICDQLIISLTIFSLANDVVHDFVFTSFANVPSSIFIIKKKTRLTPNRLITFCNNNLEKKSQWLFIYGSKEKGKKNYQSRTGKKCQLGS